LGSEYSVHTCRGLAKVFAAAGVARPMRFQRYDPGEELAYDVTGVVPARKARAKLSVERFVGGGFAGQVYRVKVLSIEGEEIVGLEAGERYALKILVPPSPRSRKFRDAVYRIGFQGPFSLQVNPDAARAGALWQKFIRRGAAIRFGDEGAVVDVIATLVDERIGSCGEISEWVDGRNWRFEVDDRLDLRRAASRGKAVDEHRLGAPEYRAKKAFMAEFVELLHQMGAPEFARQYEWWTCKSQPNVLKRTDADGEPAAGLTAVDFRAGLALLPVLPMSPGDVPLIVKGLARGALVQFDRGDTARLRAFVDRNAGDFADMSYALGELIDREKRYRSSLPDVTHNHVRLLYDRSLWRGILDATVAGWRVANVTDDDADRKLRASRVRQITFAAMGLLATACKATALVLAAICLFGWTWRWPLLIAAVILAIPIPKLLRFARSLWGRKDLREHYARIVSEPGYLRRAVRAHMAETLIAWLRAGRIGDEGVLAVAQQPRRYAPHWVLSLLPAFLHRMLTDRRYALDKLWFVFVRPVKLYFNADAREQWLREMLTEGKARHMLTAEDAEHIESRMSEPFIQKYLKSLAVHVCTLPITQVVSVAVALVYVLRHPELNWKEAMGAAGAILVAFQLTPISPGSLTRGLYVLYLVLRERNFKDYNIAVFLGFFKYVGYLAFPIQMAYRYPALARFMAAHWATGAVHVVPVFGEHGALMEHGVFDLFYNWPLTVRRRMRKRAQVRAGLKRRTWHAAPIALAAAGVFAAVEWAMTASGGVAPSLWDIWWLVIAGGAAIGAGATLWAGGRPLAGRIILSLVAAGVVGAAGAGFHAVLAHHALGEQLLANALATVGVHGVSPSAGLSQLLLTGHIADRLASVARTAPAAMLWRAFVLALVAVPATLITEVSLPEPK